MRRWVRWHSERPAGFSVVTHGTVLVVLADAPTYRKTEVQPDA